MIKINHKLRKILLGIFIAIFAFVALVIIFISPIAKYLIQKYDVKYLGREVTLDWIYVNPFTGYAHIHNLKVYEAGGMDTVFFSAKGASVNFAMLKLLSKTYEIENLTITKPYARIIQDHKDFNFNDLIARFTPKDTTKKASDTVPTHFNLLDIDITDGEFHYEERSIPVNYYVKKVNISSPGIHWNIDSTMVKMSLESGPAQGKMSADFHMNLKSSEYYVNAKIDKYDLKFIEQYLRDFSNYGKFTANLDGNIHANGNMNIKLAVDAKGWIAVNDFHFGKEVGEDYVAFKKLQIAMVDVNPRQYSYYIDTIMVDKPFFKYELYDGLDNVSALFGKNMQNIKDVQADSSKFNLVIEIGKYVNDIINNFLQSYYKINRVAIYQGDIRFNDFALREKFGIAADPLTLTADSIDKNHRRMNIRLASEIKPYGGINVGLSVDPKNYGTFEIKYDLSNIPIPLFNPFLLSYTSFPMDKGALEFHGSMNVEDSNINSTNHLLILDPRVAKRLRKEDTKWLPVPLIMSLVKDRSGVIDFTIPIQGNLKKPKFKLKDAILEVLKNIFVKPPTSPYTAHVNDVQKKVEKFLVLKWETQKYTLRYGQERFMDKIEHFLKKAPDATLLVSPEEYTDKEKEYLLFFEAKKKYWEQEHKTKQVSEDDSIAIEKMSIKDSSFVHFLNKLVGDTPMFTIQEKCKYYIGMGVVDAKYAQLLKDRQTEFLSYFDDDEKKRLKFQAGKTIIPFNGFSYYKIEYNGDVPPELLQAYEEINDYNDEKPRKKYLREREKHGGVVPEAHLQFKGK